MLLNSVVYYLQVLFVLWNMMMSFKISWSQAWWQNSVIHTTGIETEAGESQFQGLPGIQNKLRASLKETYMAVSLPEDIG